MANLKAKILMVAAALISLSFQNLLAQVNPVHNSQLPELKIIKEEVGFKTILKPTRGLVAGRKKLLHKGEQGLIEKTYELIDETYKNKPAHPKLVSVKLLKPPKDEVWLIGTAKDIPARSFYVRRTLNLLATAYDPSPRSCGRYANGRTAIGMRAGYGVVAVDPKVIPLGSKLFIDGYGFAIAGDVGSRIKGRRIDLCYNTYKQAKMYGRRWVKVYILED